MSRVLARRALVAILALAACSSTDPIRASQRPGPAPTVTTPPTTVTSTVAPIPVRTSTTPTTSTTPAVAPGTPAVGPWTPVGRVVDGVPTLVARLVPARPGGPFVGVVRMNALRTRMVLYAGTAEPGGSWPNQGFVAPADTGDLVAAFNSGFHTSSSGGGWFDHGRVAVPLREGQASLAIRADGSATVGMFGRDVSVTPDVVSVRQNLGLLVDAGANVSDGAYWGAVLGRAAYTWRSGLGVDPQGNLVYAGGPGLDASSLAQVLIDAGALRAMELDINPQWVAFSYYGGPGSGADLVPGMNYGPDHWLAAVPRDFFAVFVRSSGTVNDRGVSPR